MVAVLSSAIPYSLELEALRRIPAGVFGVLDEPRAGHAALAGFLVLGQNLVGREIVGIAAVVVASAGAAAAHRRRRRPARGPSATRGELTLPLGAQVASSQSRRGVWRCSGWPLATSVRSSPSVPKVSAVTLCWWIVSRFSWRAIT